MKRSDFSALFLIYVLSFPCAAEVPVTQGLASIAEFKEQLLLVDIDQQQLNETVLVLEDHAGTLYLSGQDLQRWRLRPPATESGIDYQGEKYYPLSAISDVSHVFDRKRLTLMIEVRPEAFSVSILSTPSAGISPPVKSGSGGFLNYDLFAAHYTDSSQRAGQFELGYFNRFGVGISNVLAQTINGYSQVTRLDTSWTVDFPEKLKTLHLGDAINIPGTWGRSVRFGGIQFGTNFGTQPGFNTFPSQSAAGQAVLPSSVDVFVNNALVSSQSVPPGPFSIRNLPIVTGAGEVQLVVRDMLGREQLVTRPFYYSQALLRKGLDSFSSELGFLRENFGLASNDYGSWLGVGTYRRGLSDNFTGEVHAEAMRNQATAGAGGDFLIPQIGTIKTYFAGSQSNSINSSSSSSGGMVLLGIDRQAHPWSFGARTQRTSSGFTQVGQLATQFPPVQMSSFNLSYSANALGTVGLAYIMQNNRDQADSRLATLSYSVSLGKIGSFSMSALRILGNEPNTTIFAMLNIPLGQSTNASVSSQSGGGRTDLTTTVQRNLPMGEGYGYRVQARTDDYREANISLQTNVGTYSVGAAQSEGSTATRLNASGGVALLGNDVFLSRRIDQSFAVARIPDYPDVRILADNQPAGRTDASGNALIPRLRAYDRNVISIDQRDLPMDAKIGAVKVEAVPYFRSGIDVTFPIKRSHGATFTIQLEDGKPLPAGASVHEVGKAEVYTVGYGGEVYVVGLGPTTPLRATWHQQSCDFDVHFLANSDPLPDLGTYTCKGVQP